MRKMFIPGLAAAAALALWEGTAGAGIFSSRGPVIAIVAGELYLGEAVGELGGTGTIRIQSRAKSDVSCSGKFTFSRDRGDAGDMQCSDGATATFQFQRLSLVRGYGTGSTTRGPMSFTYGLTAGESEPYLVLPPGKILRLERNVLVLADGMHAARGTVAPVARTTTAPDVLLSQATATVIASLKQHRDLQTTSAGSIAALVEATVLPLFDFRHMTRLAVAANWRLASLEQQNALVGEFKSLLVRTYSVALASYRDQTIEYRPLRMAAGDTEVMVRSLVRQPGTEPVTIDYDLEETAAGWKVYDIKIAGVSLITTYRSTFAQTVRDGGVDALIKALSAKNRQTDPAPVLGERRASVASQLGRAVGRSRRSYSRFTTA